MLKGERIREVVERGLGRRQLARSPQPFRWARVGERRQDRDRPAAVGDLDGLALFDLADQLAGSLAELSDAH